MAKNDTLSSAIQKLPDPPGTATVMPASHLTKAKYFKDIAKDGKLNPLECKVFKEDLIYLFYGGIFYRHDLGVTRNSDYLPIAFVFDPLIYRTNIRYFPFDTGAIEGGKFGSDWAKHFRDYKTIFRIDGNDENVLYRIIFHLFRDNSYYLQGKANPECLKLPSPICDLHAFYEADLTAKGVDHRQSCIECQFTEPIEFDPKLIWIGYPEDLQDEFITYLWPKIRPHIPVTFKYSYHKNIHPRDLTAMLQQQAEEDVIKRYVNI